MEEGVQQQPDAQSGYICKQVIERHITDRDQRLRQLCAYGQEQAKCNSEEHPSPESAEEPGTKSANKPGNGEKAKVGDFIKVLEPSRGGYLRLCNRSKQQAEEDQCPHDNDGKIALHLYASPPNAQFAGNLSGHYVRQIHDMGRYYARSSFVVGSFVKRAT